ncbi:MAG: prephenate dehydrogenase/arogenate dehydrogenase family protein [Candidatus Omnitrophica bacterium]|nr:prephenate dehydrogenase/arogenate dehydrogenase family protein [Candidatus Omnitrophota bacterium]
MDRFENIGVAGLGLIGGSLALEIKKRGIARRVTGFSRRLSTLKKAKERGIIDEYFTDFEEGVKGLDFLIITTPVNVVKDYFAGVKKSRPELLVTDAASVKVKIVREARRILGKDANFVGSHPMAGSEKSGIDAAKEGLFENRFVIITPSKYTGKENVAAVKDFWSAAGSIPVFLSPRRHDRMLALTSHMPHLIVYTLVSLLGKVKDKETLLKCVGAGFLDTTRIGKSSPELWAEIFTANRENMVSWISEFEKALAGMKKIVNSGSCRELAEKLGRMKKMREELDEKRKNI